MTNFKLERFEGTLLELIDRCNAHVATVRGRVLEHHGWLLQQLSQAPNLLPIRKGQTYRERGRVVEVGAQCYLIADNEPLASQFKYLLDEVGRPQGSFFELLQAGRISASWKSEVAAPSGLRFRGVATSFRQRGLKLAHVFDAAAGLDRVAPLERQFEFRYLRSQSPLNVFLFPGPRSASVRILEGLSPTRSDLGEDPAVRAVVMGYLADRLQLAPEEWNLFRAGLDGVDLEVVADWEQIGNTTRVEVTPGPRHALPSGSARAGLRTPIIPPAQRQGDAPRRSGHASAGEKRWNTAKDALSLEEAIVLLREWMAHAPDVTRLDGRSEKKSNPSPWLHLRIDGYEGQAVFSSRFGPVFNGEDYNGVVNFHGDASAETIRRFVELYEAAESVHDVLVPSATFETYSNLPSNVRAIRPKFALRGFSDAVEGFFLYHDQHAGIPV